MSAKGAWRSCVRSAGTIFTTAPASRCQPWSASCFASGARAIRSAAAHYYFFNDWDRYQSRGVLMFARYDGARYTLVAINTGDTDQTVPFWFPIAGSYVEELHGGGLDLRQFPLCRRSR